MTDDSDPRLHLIFLGISRFRPTKRPSEPRSDHESDNARLRAATFRQLPESGVHWGVRGPGAALADLPDVNMNVVANLLRLYRRQPFGTYYLLDVRTGRPESLRTKDRRRAERLFQARLESLERPEAAYKLGMAYLQTADPEAETRTWGDLIDAYAAQRKAGPTRHRIEVARRDRALAALLGQVILRTRAEDLIAALGRGGVSTNVHLRRFQNYALDMGWIPRPILPRPLWPRVRHQRRIAITEEQHRRIVARETNPERRAYYQVCWFLGGANSDMAHLRAENIDWTHRTVSFVRRKTQEPCFQRFGDECAGVLGSLPRQGPLFPYLCTVRESDRATEFRQRCHGLGIEGVTLHSYRYAWAERAAQVGMPERFAQAALGHGSRAVHRAYAQRAVILTPCLEELAQDNERRLRTTGPDVRPQFAA